MARSAAHIVISRVGGFVFFIILLALANLLVPGIQNQAYTGIVGFFNSNLYLLLAIMLVGMVNEIFWNSGFPAMLLAPISGSLLAVYVIMFIYSLWQFLDAGYFKINAAIPIFAIYTLVAILTLTVGYLIVFLSGGEAPEDMRERMHELRHERWKKREERMAAELKKSKVEWEDVGDEFKLFFYNFGRSLNSMFEKKKKK
jgi:hypothetical protein